MLVTAVCVAAVMVAVGGARAWRGDVLPSLKHGAVFATAKVATKLPRFDADAARVAADAAAAAKVAGGERTAHIVAEPFVVEADPGVWSQAKSGSGAAVWRAEFAAPGATDLNVHLSECALPEGAQLYVSGRVNGDDAFVFGPYDQARCDSFKGQFWSPVVDGDRVVLEVFAPSAAARAGVRVTVGEVFRGFRSLHGVSAAASRAKPLEKFFGAARKRQGSCNIDVACPEAKDWSDTQTSVARVLFGGSGLCTGTLLKGDDGDQFTPFFASAYHCVSGSEERAENTVTFWGYESPTCGELCCGDMSRQLAVGSKFQWMERSNDGLLLVLGGRPNESPDTERYNAFYAGWDRATSPPDGVVGISHPSAGVKTIVFSTETPALTDSCIGGGGSDSHWRFVWNDGGTTEPGSSGSCMFDRNTQRCVGFLSGGTASCSNQSGYDCYGAAHVAYARGMTMMGDAMNTDGKYMPSQ